MATRKWAQAILLTAVSVAFALGSVEALLRLFPGLLPEETRLKLHWQGLRDDRSETRRDPEIGFLYLPHYRGEKTRGDFVFDFAIDGHGFRNPWPWPEHAEIVAVGDSMVFGYGVNDGEGWVARLEQHMPDCRVMNLGLAGTGPPQYREIYEKFGEPLRPKLLIFGVFPGNDYDDASDFDRWRSSGAPGNYSVWRRTGGQDPTGGHPIQDTLERSYLVGLVRASVNALRGLAERRFVDRTLKWKDGQQLTLVPNIVSRATEGVGPGERRFDLVMGAIAETHARAQQTGVSFLVLLFPSKEEVYLPLLQEKAPQAVSFLASHLEAAGIPFFDLTESLQEAAREGKTVFFNLDGHPNREGYKEIAATLASHLKQHADRFGLGTCARTDAWRAAVSRDSSPQAERLTRGAPSDAGGRQASGPAR